MKNLFVTLLLMAVSFTYAQTNKEDAAIIRAVFNKEKKEIFLQYMAIDGATADAFWKVYDEFEAKRNNLSAERFSILNDYANSYDTLTDEKAADLSKRLFTSDQDILNLQKSYFKKFEKVAGARNAAKFFQLESYLQSVIRMQIQDNIPFIDELGDTKKM